MARQRQSFPRTKQIKADRAIKVAKLAAERAARSDRDQMAKLRAGGHQHCREYKRLEDRVVKAS